GSKNGQNGSQCSTWTEEFPFIGRGGAEFTKDADGEKVNRRQNKPAGYHNKVQPETITDTKERFQIIENLTGDGQDGHPGNQGNNNHERQANGDHALLEPFSIF